MKKLLAAVLLLISAGACAETVALDFTDPSVPTSGTEFNLGGLNFLVTPDPLPNPPGYQTSTNNALGICPGCELIVTDLGSTLTTDIFDLDSIQFSSIFGDYTVRLTVDYRYFDTEVIDLLASDGLHTLNLWGIESLTLTNLDSPATIISSMTVNAIPVPAAVWLFASALGALGWRKRFQTVIRR